MNENKTFKVAAIGHLGIVIPYVCYTSSMSIATVVARQAQYIVLKIIILHTKP